MSVLAGVFNIISEKQLSILVSNGLCIIEGPKVASKAKVILMSDKAYVTILYLLINFN